MDGLAEKTFGQMSNFGIERVDDGNVLVAVITIFWALS